MSRDEEARRRYRAYGPRAAATSRKAADIIKDKMRAASRRRAPARTIERWRRIRALSEAGYSLEEAAETLDITPRYLRACIRTSEHWTGWPLRPR